jgi:hypothetical protein
LGGSGRSLSCLEGIECSWRMMWEFLTTGNVLVFIILSEDVDFCRFFAHNCNRTPSLESTVDR